MSRVLRLEAASGDESSVSAGMHFWEAKIKEIVHNLRPIHYKHDTQLMDQVKNKLVLTLSQTDTGKWKNSTTVTYYTGRL